MINHCAELSCSAFPRVAGEVTNAAQSRNKDPRPIRAVVIISGSTVGNIFLAKTYSTDHKIVAIKINNSPVEKVNPLNPPMNRLPAKRSKTARIL